MRMLEPRDKLRLGFEAADEIRMVRKRWQDNLDRDFALDVWLGGAIHGSHAPTADFLSKGIPANGATGQVFRSDLLHAGSWRRHILWLRADGASAAHKLGAVIQWDRKRHGKAFGDLDRRARVLRFDLADCDGSATHTTRQLL